MARKRRARQGELPFKMRGGARDGAGRKPKGKRPGVSHKTRGRLASRFPVHVTVRLRAGLPSLRQKETYELILRVFEDSEKGGFRVVHYSVQGNHVHMIVEAKDRESLSRGVQGLLIRFARGVNRLWGRVGKVFSDRYHDVILRTPRQVRRALVYVFRNAWRHRVRVEQCIDIFTSAPWFEGWTEKLSVSGLPAVCPVAKARTWLLNKGWREHHGTISLKELPGR